MPRKIILVAYAPPLTEADDRPRHLLETIESVLVRDRMEYTISPQGACLRIQNREAFLQTGASRGEIPLVCNGAEDRLVSVSGHVIPAVLAPGRAPVLDVAIVAPEAPDYVRHAEDFMLGACECLKAFWAVASPNDAAAVIGAQTVFPWAPSEPPLGLPALLPPQQMSSPILPHQFGWLNYWSAETAQALAFPGHGNDAGWFAGSRRGQEGGRLLKLTDLPLDLAIPEHIERLKEAYDRFPMVGRR